MSLVDREATIARIVLDHPETAKVFQDHRIDFCCRGNMTLDAACQQRNVDPRVLFEEIEESVRTRTADAAEIDTRSLATPQLIEHIVERHHRYLRTALPWVGQMSAKVARVHGDHDPQLAEVDAGVRSLTAALLPHLDQEEQDLFPRLQSGTPPTSEVSLDAMLAEHLEVGAQLERIRNAARDFAVPAWACNTYRTLLAELQALETDVLRHVHIENHVLAPRFQH